MRYSPLLAVITLPFLFGIYRFVEMAFIRHKFDYLLLQTISDTLFFFFWNIPLFIFIIFFKNLKHKSKIEKAIFILLNLPLFFLFILDAHTLSVRGMLFGFDLIKLFRLEMFSMSFLIIKEYYFLFIFVFPAIYWVARVCPLILDKKLYSKKITLFLISVFILSFSVYMPVLLKLSIQHRLTFFSELRYNSMAYRIFKLAGLAGGEFIPPVVADDEFIQAQCKTKFFNDEELNKNLSSLKKKNTKGFKKKKDNVIIIVIESFNYMHLNEKYTPFMLNMSQNGYYGKMHMNIAKNTRISISSIIRSQFPHLLSSNPNYIPPIKVFKEKSYSNFFFFGGTKSTYKFDKLAKQNDLKFLAKEEYLKDVKEGSKHIDKSGDIFDDKFFSYVARKLKKEEKPFFSIILTNQPHYPFDCEGAVMKAPKEERYLSCLRYIDRSIKEFISDLGEDISRNTLFVVTGDHATSTNRHENFLLVKLLKVPLIFYSMREDLSKYNDDSLTSHVDIIPSVIDYLNWDYPLPLVYNSVFDSEVNKAFFYSYFRNSYLMFFEDYVTEYSCLSDKTTISHDKNFFFKKAGEEVKDRELYKKYDNLLKTYIQYTTHNPLH